MKTLLLYSSVVVAGVVIGTGCRSPLSGHCFNEEGDRTCGEGRFCNRCLPEGDGCVDAMPSEECHFPGLAEDGSSSSGEAPSGEATMTPAPTTDSEMSGTTGPTPCTDEGDCPTDAAPFCDTSRGECVPCDVLMDPDGACAALDAEAPLCVNGSCAECRPEDPLACDAEPALCDGNTNACLPCTEHGQCGIGACQLAVGRCFPQGPQTVVAHVDWYGEQDYPSIVAAIDAVADGGFGVITVRDINGASYQPGVLIDGGKTIALLAALGHAPIIQGTAGLPGLRVEGEGTVLYMDGLAVALSQDGAVGLEVDAGLAWLDRSRTVANAGGGIVATNGADLTLRNCFVGGGTDVVGLEIVDASANILYSTVASSTFLETPVLRCTGAGPIYVRNSIVVSQGDAPAVRTSCTAASLAHSATEADLGVFDIEWFADFNTGDFSLTASGGDVFADVAQWRTGDPATDIDGDLRPTTHEAPDFAGADRPSP